MTTEKRQGHVLFCSDDGGFLPLKVALYSLLRAAEPTRPLRVSVFTGGEGALSPAHRHELEALAAAKPGCRVDVIDVSAQLTRYHAAFFNPQARWGILTWARLFIGEVFASETGNIVYLDIDTFICRDLGELYDLDLGTDALAAVYEDSRAEGMVRDPACWTNAALLDPAATHYFNAGVLVFNLKLFRDENILARAADWYARRRDEAIRCDQDALNALLWDRVRPLPPKWNFSDGWCERQLKHAVREKAWRGNAPRTVLEAILSPAILHFWGKSKPWKWNHRPERKRYERAMRELGMLEKGRFLPGTTLPRRLVAVFFDMYHAVLRAVAAGRLAACGKTV